MKLKDLDIVIIGVVVFIVTLICLQVGIEIGEFVWLNFVPK